MGEGYVNRWEPLPNMSLNDSYTHMYDLQHSIECTGISHNFIFLFLLIIYDYDQNKWNEKCSYALILCSGNCVLSVHYEIHWCISALMLNMDLKNEKPIHSL